MQPHNLTRDEARTRGRLIADLSYEVALDLAGDDEQTFGCDATIRFRCAEPGASTFIDLYAPVLEGVSLNGKPLGDAAFDGARIALPRLEAENELRILARCAYQLSGAGLHWFRDPVDDRVYLHTQLEPRDAHRIYPCFDQPDLKGTFALRALAPAEWEVVSNGRAVERPADGRAGRWRFERTPRLPTYITAVVAGPYHAVRDRYRDIDLGIYCRQSLAQYLDHEEFFEVTKQGFEFFERVFDYPYAFGKYDQLLVPEFASGAMENAGCVTFHEQFIFRSKVTDAARESRAGTILHELAHMWFGDLATMRWWDDLWLNESFATFMGTLSLVENTRFTSGWTSFAQKEKTWAYEQDQLPSTHPITADCPDVETAILNFDGVTYAKGASVLRQLVAWVGEDAFLDGCRRYFRRFEYGNAELSDFLGCLEEASGRDLKAWAKEWLQTAGVNTLRPSFRVSGDSYAAFSVAQEAPAEWPVLRPHRVGVALYDAAPEGLLLRRRVETDVFGARTEIRELAGERAADLVLLNHGDLAYAKIRLDERSFATVNEHLRDLDDSLARALCWTAAWDMVRDGELPSRSFVRLVLANIAGESEISVVQSLQSDAAMGAVWYGDPRNRIDALEAIAEASLAALRSAEPSSDHQLAWARCLIGTARSADHLAIVRGLLDGAVTVDGLAVDIDIRWQIVRALAASGAAGEDLITAELGRDPTDQGRRHAATARARRPDPAVKAATWETILGEADMPLASLQAMINGFVDYEREELLAPFVPSYFSSIERVWGSRDREVAIAILEMLYPSYAVSEGTIELTDAALASGAPAAPVRRILIEGRDNVRRALRARACDAAAS